MNLDRTRFSSKKSNHIFTVRQHIVLLVLRQYENKSYRMFVEWLLEAYYLRMFMQLSHIPHYTTLQKFAARVSGTILGRIISSFILLLSNIRRLYSSGFKLSSFMSSCVLPGQEKEMLQVLLMLAYSLYAKTIICSMQEMTITRREN